MPYMANSASFLKSDLQNFYKNAKNKPRCMGAMFLTHHDGLNNHDRGSSKIQFC